MNYLIEDTKECKASLEMLLSRLDHINVQLLSTSLPTASGSVNENSLNNQTVARLANYIEQLEDHIDQFDVDFEDAQREEGLADPDDRAQSLLGQLRQQSQGSHSGSNERVQSGPHSEYIAYQVNTTARGERKESV